MAKKTKLANDEAFVALSSKFSSTMWHCVIASELPDGRIVIICLFSMFGVTPFPKFFSSLFKFINEELKLISALNNKSCDFNKIISLSIL